MIKNFFLLYPTIFTNIVFKFVKSNQFIVCEKNTFNFYRHIDFTGFIRIKDYYRHFSRFHSHN